MPLASPAVAPVVTTPDPDLLLLRGELDRIDDAVHDLVMRRAAVAQRIGALGVKGPVPLRPGREASIVRRLLSRHAGPFPAASMVRLWRELICGMTAVQQPLRIAVAGDGPAYMAAAREHFGGLAPLRQCAAPAQALGEVRAGHAVAALLPMPRESEQAQDAWWTALLRQGDAPLHIVAKLPFWAARPEGAPLVEAVVVTSAAPDPSGMDRSLLGLELGGESRARLLQDLSGAGFQPGPAILRHDPGQAALALVDVEGFVHAADPRLPSLAARKPAVVGAYAVPIEARP